MTEWVTPAGPASVLEATDLEKSAESLPADTLGFVAAGFDPDFDHWRVALADRQLSDVLPGEHPVEGMGPMLPGLGGGTLLSGDTGLAEALDVGLEVVLDTTGINLETDFFDHLAGTTILAIRDFEIAAVRDYPSDNPVEAVAMLSYKEDGRDDLHETMSRVAELAQTHAGIIGEEVDVGGESPATVFDLAPLGMLIGPAADYQPGYVLHDQYLTVGTTPGALTTTVALQNGQGASLSSNAGYQRAVLYLPATRQVLGYVNAQRVIGQLEADDLGLDADEYQAVRDGLNVLVFGSHGGDDHNRSVAVLTLFPE